MQCSSIAADGSDFIINGPYPVAINSAAGDCSNNLTKEITIKLSQPVRIGGHFQLILKRGSDGNALLDECGEETTVGSSLPFMVKDTVNADFSFTKRYGA